MHNLNNPLLAVLVLFLSGPSFAQGWFEYINQADHFSVNFPAEPEVREFAYNSEYEFPFPARIYSVQVGANSYSATVVDFTDSARIHAEADRPEAASGPTNWLYDQRASVARAAREFRQRGGEVTYDAWSHMDRVEGHQIQMINSDGSRTYAGIYLNGNVNRLYVLEATVPPGSIPPILFQQSIRFLDEEGERIRYLLSTNGCAVAPDDPAIGELSVR